MRSNLLIEISTARKKTTKTTTTDATNDEIDILNTLPNKLRVFCLKNSVDDDGIHKTQKMKTKIKLRLKKCKKYSWNVETYPSKTWKRYCF